LVFGNVIFFFNFIFIVREKEHVEKIEGKSNDIEEDHDFISKKNEINLYLLHLVAGVLVCKAIPFLELRKDLPEGREGLHVSTERAVKALACVVGPRQRGDRLVVLVPHEDGEHRLDSIVVAVTEVCPVSIVF